MRICFVSINLLPLFFSEIISSCFETWSMPNTIASGQKISGYVFKTHSKVNTWVSCARLCLLRSLCKSFNYNEETQECEMNWKAAGTPEINTATSEKWLYGDASLIPQSLVGSCANHGCLNYQVCVPDETGSFCLDRDKCKTAEAGSGVQVSFVNNIPTFGCKSSWIVANEDSSPTCSYTSSGFRWTTDLLCVYIDD